MRKSSLFLILSIILLLSCGGGEGDSNTPDVVVSSERIEVSNVTMLSEGGEKQVVVNANCAWVITVPAADSWLSINPSSGANTQTITISCTANTSTNSRTSVVTIAGKQRTTAFTVTQKAPEIVPITISNFSLSNVSNSGADYSFSLSPVSDDISSVGVCYATDNDSPSTSDQVSVGTRSGSTVSGNISGLKANTTYKVRAYVTNASGTYYSQMRQITTENNIPGKDDNIPPSAN